MEKVTTYHNVRKFKSCVVRQFIVILLRLRLICGSRIHNDFHKNLRYIYRSDFENIRVHYTGDKFYEYYNFDFIEIYFLSNPCSLVLVNMIILKNKMMNFRIITILVIARKLVLFTTIKTIFIMS